LTSLDPNQLYECRIRFDDLSVWARANDSLINSFKYFFQMFHFKSIQIPIKTVEITSDD
jgi:hypothetical protein